EVLEHHHAQQSGMQRGDAVDFAAAHDGEVAHAHRLLVLFTDDAHATNATFVAWEAGTHLLQIEVIDLVDDLQVPRQYTLEQPHRPLLEGLGHQGVIGIVDRCAYDLPGLAPGVAVL